MRRFEGLETAMVSLVGIAARIVVLLGEEMGERVEGRTENYYGQGGIGQGAKFLNTKNIWASLRITVNLSLIYLKFYNSMMLTMALHNEHSWFCLQVQSDGSVTNLLSQRKRSNS